MQEKCYKHQDAWQWNGSEKLQKITYVNVRGESVEFSHRPPFLLSKLDGLGDIQAEVQSQKSPYQDGSTFIDSLLEERHLTMEISILGNGREDISKKRQKLSRVFNPKLGLGKIIYENGEIKREIQAVSEHVPIFGSEGRGLRYQIALVDLICHSPFWEELNPQIVKLEDFVSNFRFPFSFPVRFATRGDSRVLINSGDVPTPVTVTFRGEATNPKITNLDTGEFIKVNRHIPANYQLVIDTKFGNKTVKIVAPDGVEMNAMGYIDLDSSFFQLDVGENKFSFITEGGRPEVYIQYKNMYLGV